MDLDARPYRSFLAVTEMGSFRRAAEAMHVSQPALSAQIKEFERRLGFALFSRQGRTVALTVEGRMFMDHARRMVVETEWAANAAREIATNRLRIGAAHHTAQIAERNKLIDDFLVREPGIPFSVLRRSPAQLVRDLEEGLIDLAILLDFEGTQMGSPEFLAFEQWRISSRSLRLWVPGDHPLGLNNPIAIGALKGQRIGTIDRSHGVAVAEGVARILASAGALSVKLPEGDARSVMRQCSRLCMPAVDLGWYSSPGSEMSSIEVREWTARTTLLVLANKRGRRDGADRFLAAISADDLPV